MNLPDYRIIGETKCGTTAIKKTGIIIVGGGGHSKVIISILKRLSEFEIIGYTDNKDKGAILGIKYLGSDSVLENYIKNDITNAAIGIGQLKDHQLRKKVTEFALSLGYKFPAIIAPTAIVNEEVDLDRGVVVMDGTVINPGTRIGAFSIINTRASIDHDCSIGQFVHLAPGVTLSGSVTVKDYTLIGTGASVIQNITIEENCTIGAGSAIMRDCIANRTYIGSPATRLSKEKDK